MQENSGKAQAKNQKDALLFIYDLPQGYLALKLDYVLKKQDITVNLVRTATILKDKHGLTKYKVLKGKL